MLAPEVLLILGSAPGYPEPHEFNINGVKVISLSPNTMSLIQPLDEGHKDTRGSLHIYSIGGIVNAMEKNPNRTHHESH